ncbi:MAG TPA: hypothetical protein VJ375_07425 [Gaiellaceae bacterium]|jgi:hypothetical protein|nr:hypothetical protein [Gaiellaceae bacterium]
MQRSASPWLDLEREFVQTVGFVYGVPNFLATDKEPDEAHANASPALGQYRSHRCGARRIHIGIDQANAV